MPLSMTKWQRLKYMFGLYTPEEEVVLEQKVSICGLILRFIGLYWRSMVVILAPPLFLLLPLLNDFDKRYRVMWLLLVMATYWVTEALPLAITSCLPIVVLPLMDIMGTNEVTMLYWRETTVMLLGSVIVALAIEHSQLHKRIAITTMIHIGCTQRRISFSLTLVTAFMSMWISNTAAAAMMLPIGRAVLEEVEAKNLCRVYEPRTAEDDPDEPPRLTNISNAFFLGIVYASSIGGCCTVIGTGTNLVLQGTLSSFFPNAPELDFARFMLYATPVLYILLLFTWMWVQVRWLGMFRPSSKEAAQGDLGAEGNRVLQESIEQKYIELGRMSSHEASVLVLFLIAVGVWFFRSPGFIKGWAPLFSDLKIKDSTASFLVITLMFVLPCKWSWLDCFSCDPKKFPKKNSAGLLTWKVINDQVPWSLMFLIGAGFAMSEAGKQTGMSALIADKLSGLKSLPNVVILLLICGICQVMTEFSSNVAVANIVQPILCTMAVTIKVNPLFLTVPAAISQSFAFNTVVGTPPNAIGNQVTFIRSTTYLKTGIVLSLVAWILNVLAFPTYGSVVFENVNSFPAWARSVQLKWMDV